MIDDGWGDGGSDHDLSTDSDPVPLPPGDSDNSDDTPVADLGTLKIRYHTTTISAFALVPVPRVSHSDQCALGVTLATPHLRSWSR
jgi:hypothetical protein